MKTTGVVTDSHSGILPKEAKELEVLVLPMPFYIDDECYFEEISITREDFFNQMRDGKKVATSQPSPDDVMNIWREALKKYEEIVYIPISSGLSGSCSTAQMLASEPEFENKVFVVDNGRVSAPLHRSVLDALELIQEGFSAEKIKRILEDFKGLMNIYVAVETLENLKKGGRITPATATIGSLLNIKPVLKFDVGVLETHKKCRGMKKARKEMLDAVKHDFETRYKEYYDNGEIYLMAASSADEETTQSWLDEIHAYFPGMDVLCDMLTLGLSCHIGEGGLGIAVSCRPRR